MVKVSVSSVGTQASTVAISMFSRVSALNDAITKLSSFAEAATLQGTAYSNAKSYATGTLTPMLQGMILFSETLSEKCTELQTLYVSICGDEDLDSVVLESKLASDRASLKIAEALLEHLNDDPEPSKSAISSTKSNIKKLKKRIKSNQKKLDNLNEFNAHSATVFADISNAQSTVNQALAAVSTGFSGYNSKTGAFGKPTSGQMEWTKTVKKNWKEREDAKAEELKSKKAEESKKASKIENTTKNGGDWKNKPGYQTTHEAKTGYAISFSPGQAGADRTYGHVAIVEDVKEDGSIPISESNVLGLGTISYRTFSAAEAAQLTYVVGEK
ncbi:TPA: CHAP domain-containing protein [Streptococcus agalactiae]